MLADARPLASAAGAAPPSATPDWDDWIGLPSTRQALQRLLDEWRQAAVLHDRGLAPRHAVLLIGPPDCGQSFVVERLADRLKLAPQILSFEAWAALPSAQQWAALDHWAASGSLLVLRHAHLLSEPTSVIQASPAARRLLAWWDSAPADRLYLVRDVPTRPVARAVLRTWPEWVPTDPPAPDAMHVFVTRRMAGWPLAPEAVDRLRQVTVGFTFGDLARMVANAQKATLLTDIPLGESLVQAMIEEQRHLHTAEGH